MINESVRISERCLRLEVEGMKKVASLTRVCLYFRSLPVVLLYSSHSRDHIASNIVHHT